MTLKQAKELSMKMLWREWRTGFVLKRGPKIQSEYTVTGSGRFQSSYGCAEFLERLVTPADRIVP